MFYQILLEFAYISEMKKREALRKKKDLIYFAGMILWNQGDQVLFVLSGKMGKAQ